MNLALRSLVPALVVSALCVVVAGVVAGGDGAAGAAVGAGIVVVFFASSPLVLGPVTKVSPHLSVAVALTFFLTKVVALLALFVVLIAPDGPGRHLDSKSLGSTVIVCALTWSFLQIWSATKSRQPLYDLDSDH